MKILYMGDGEWGKLSLSKLLQNNCEIVGVVLRTNPSDENLYKLAKKNNLPIYQPKNINSDIFYNKVKELNPDLIISMSYDQIIKEKLINYPPNGIINVHAGLLPYYRGRSPINWALINGEDYIGLTVHYIDKTIDTGDIILQRKIKINADDDYKSILKKTQKLAPELLFQAVVLIENDAVVLKENNPDKGFYLPKRTEGDEIINWSWSSKRIHNFIRALVPPGPCARTYLDGQEIKILKSKLIDKPNFVGNCGQILENNNGIIVKTGDSVIKIIKIVKNGMKKKPDFNIGKNLGAN